MKNKLLYYVFFIAFFISFSIAYASTFDGFETYQNGNIGGQGNWFQVGYQYQWQVNEDRAYSGIKSLKTPYSGYYSNGRYFDDEQVLDEGKITLRFYQNDFTYFLFTIQDTTGSYHIARFFSEWNPNTLDYTIYYFSNNGFQYFGTISANIWNKLEISFRKNSEDNNLTYVKYTVNDTMDSGWVLNSSGYRDDTLYANRIYVEGTSSFNNYSVYIDNLEIEPLYLPIPTGYYGTVKLTNYSCGYNSIATTTLTFQGEIEIPQDGDYIRNINLVFENLNKGYLINCFKPNVNALEGQKTLFSVQCNVSDVLKDDNDLVLLTIKGFNKYLHSSGQFKDTEYKLIQCAYYFGFPDTMQEIQLTPTITSLTIPDKEDLKEDCDQYQNITDKLICGLKNALIDIFYPSKSKIEQLLSYKNIILTKFPINYFNALLSFFKNIDISKKEIELGMFNNNITLNTNYYENLPFIGTIFSYLQYAFDVIILFLFIKVFKKEFDYLMKALT